MTIHGKVVKGLGIGKKLGYPTANLEIYGGPSSGAPEDGPPYIQPGVYAARATYDGAVHDAAVVIGARHDGGKPLIEVHLLNFDGDIRGKEIELEVIDKVSDIEAFENDEELKKKISDDIQLCLQALSRRLA